MNSDYQLERKNAIMSLNCFHVYFNRVAPAESSVAHKNFLPRRKTETICTNAETISCIELVFALLLVVELYSDLHDFA